MNEEIIFRTIFRIKRGYSEDWRDINPILEAGEPGFEIDKGNLKVGNGVSKWNDLPYISEAFSLSPDKNSLILNNYGKLQVYGFENAKINTIPMKTENGTIKWVPNSEVFSPASEEKAGTMKLYSKTGQNIDGTITQKGISDSLDDKVEMKVDSKDERLILGSNL